MIGFATLFLGLVFGVVNVELDGAGEVRSAKLLLDGKEVATVSAPWRTQVDLGPVLSPRSSLLAPDVQERILALESVTGTEPLSEGVLRPVARGLSWEAQRALIEALCDGSGRSLRPDGRARKPRKHVPFDAKRRL